MEVKVSLARAKTGNLCACTRSPYPPPKSDWASEDNKGGGRGGGGPPTIRPPSSLSKRSVDWEGDSGHMSDVCPRGSQTLKRPQPRRHHTVGFETGSMSTLPRPSLDLESHLPKQRSHSLYQPPSSVYDEDPGIMSEVETSATGFRRASKARSSLPIVRTPSKTQERPLGLVFLQYQSETKRALLPNEITSMDTVRALFVRSFPKQLTMEYLDSPHIRVYIHDPAKDMFYELEDLRDIRDRSVLRIYEQDVNGGGVYSTYDQDLSYFSEPEFDSEYQHQHIHRSKASKAPLPPAVGYYGTLPAQYLPANRTQTLPHSASMRTYSPSHAATADRQKTQTLPPGGGGTLPPPKPQRSFQQTLTPLGKTIRSTPPPTGPPPSIPSPRSGQPRPLVPIGTTMPMSPERRHEPLGSYRAPPDRPYSVAGQATYHISPERRYDPSYHSSPERRSQQESGYLSSPERRVDHQRSFSGYSTSSSYEDSVYGGSIYGTRSGSVTPVIDDEAKLRMEYMERQLASLTGLVQKALTTGPPPNKNQPANQQQLQQIPTRDCEQGKVGNSTKVHLTPEMYAQLRHLRKQTKDLRLEVRNLRRIAQAQSVTARDTVRETCIKIKSMLAHAQSGEDQVCAERLRVSREEDLYSQDVTRLEKDLTELETHVEELRSNVINRKCRVNMSDVEGMALVLSRASKTVADLKARFPNLQDSLKSVMAAEMEVVVREEKFLKDEPDRLENALRRCKKLTGTLVTLKRLASVQEQRNTGALTTPEKSSSSEGNHSDGEVHNIKALASDLHTVIHVPPGGHQRASENALDALLDELQTFTKPLEQQRDNIPGLLGPQRRLPSYPSAESPVRSPARSFAPSMPGQPEVTTSGNSAFRSPATITSKLQVSESGGQRTIVSPSHSPVPDTKKPQDMIARVAVNPGGNTKQTVIDGVEGTVTNPIAQKKAPPPPPPRTTSKSPLTSPTTDSQDNGPGSPRDVVFSQLRSNSAPVGESDGSVKRMTAPRSVSKDEGSAQKEKDEELLRTSAISDDALRRETLSSNSSSSESVNSQEGLQVGQSGNGLSSLGKLERKASGNSSRGTPPDGGTPNKSSKKLGPPTPPRTRQDVLEHRHQELLRKQKLLQDQYTRLQQLQNSQILQRFPSRSATSTPIMNDLKKTGSESNILSKSALSMTPSSGSLTHLAGNAVNFNPKEAKPSVVVTTANSKAPAVPAKPTTTQVQKNKIYETDIL